MKKVKSKGIWLLALVAVAVLAIAGVIAYDKSDEPSPEEDQQATVKSINNVDAPSLKGLNFTVPEGWMVYGQDVAPNEQGAYYLMSGDLMPSDSEPYPVPETESGTRISVKYTPRDFGKEATYDLPEKAYVEVWGAPKIDGNQDQHGEEFVDYSQFITTENQNGVKLYSYRWSHEGCSVITILLSETDSYQANFMRPQCTLDFLSDADGELYQLLDSISLNNVNSVKAAASVVQTEEEDGVVKVEVTTGYSKTSFAPLYDEYNTRQVVPKLDQEGRLKSIDVGTSTRPHAWYCVDKICAYNTQVTYESEAPANLDEYRRLNDRVYGQFSDISVTLDAEENEEFNETLFAKEYEYYVKDPNGDGYFRVQYTAAGPDKTDEVYGELLLPELDNTVIVDKLMLLERTTQN